MNVENMLLDCRAFVFMMRATHGPNTFTHASIDADARALAKILYPNSTDLPPQKMESHGPGSDE